MPRKRAHCHVIAGANGAGKTTFATEFLPVYAECRNFINADLIARGLAPFAPETGLARAGRIALERIEELAEAGADFGFETTLAGRTYASILRRLRARGYRIHLFYLWIPSADLALLRIRDRVESGGHDVPEVDVRRRFSRTLRNLLDLYRPLCDTVHFFDNSSDVPRLVFEEEFGRTTVLDPTLYEEILRPLRP
ncbi:zeta toxin family protein [Opitutales bacterium ASA1]|uniref:zeta toxin family protein n=1 Tax=Congregicoccus parvus TaxID=3081749 RepID=UPI002B2C4FBA|nr:zeta toxin family protein [Opitutales bacterium ASA1]